MGDPGPPASDYPEPGSDLWYWVVNKAGQPKEKLWPLDSETAAVGVGRAWQGVAGKIRDSVSSAEKVAAELLGSWPDAAGYEMYHRIRTSNGQITGIAGQLDSLGKAFIGYGIFVNQVKKAISSTVSDNTFAFSLIRFANPWEKDFLRRQFAQHLARQISKMISDAADEISNPDANPENPDIHHPGPLGGIWDGVVEFGNGLGGLIGYNDGDWNVFNAVDAWEGFGKLAAALAIYTQPELMELAVLDQTTGLPGLEKGALGNILLETGKSLIAWDDWSTDPAYALTKTLTNVVTFAGTDGVGAGLRSAGLAAEAAGLSRAGSLAARAGDALIALPRISDLGLRGLGKIGDVAGSKIGDLVDAVRNRAKIDDAPKLDTPGSPHRQEPGQPLGPRARPPKPPMRQFPHPQHPLPDHPGPPHHAGEPGRAHRPPDSGSGVDNQHDGAWRGEEFGRPLHLDHEANQAATHFLENAARNERGITDSLQRIADHLRRHAPDTRLAGLDFRLKGAESLRRKLATQLGLDPTLAPHEVLADMKDAVRYTYEIPSRDYAQAAERAYRELTADGFAEIKWNDTWAGDDYKGINSAWLDPRTGQKFEVQFHTPESLAAKEETHLLYEQQRLPGVSAEQKAALQLKQRGIFANLETPPGVDKLNPRDTLPGHEPEVDSAGVHNLINPAPTGAGDHAAGGPAPPGSHDIHHDEYSTRHILDGEGGSQGGHRAGTGVPGKSEFPAHWSDRDILEVTEQIARTTEPVKGPYPSADSTGVKFPSWEYVGEHDGVRVRVHVLADGRIRTAYPVDGASLITNPPAINPPPKGTPPGASPRFSHPDVGGDGTWTYEGPKKNKATGVVEILRMVTDGNGTVLSTEVVGVAKK